MSLAYNLDPDSAKEGSGNVGNYITDTGPYTGKIVMARSVVAPKGTQGIEITFQGADNREAKFTLWTQNAQGEQIWGYKQLMALMTCMKVRGIQPVKKVIDVYSYEQKTNVATECDTYPELMKPIGIVFQKETYTNHNNEDKSKVNFFAPFDPQTKQMAVEILDKSEAQTLENIIANLKDKDSRTKSTFVGQQAPNQSGPASGSYDEFDDDIPF